MTERLAATSTPKPAGSKLPRSLTKFVGREKLRSLGAGKFWGDDAKKVGVRDGDAMRITSRRGEAIIKTRVTAMPQPGTVFVPFCWEDDAGFINCLTIDAFDPGSKQPEFKICAVQLTKA